MPELPKKSVILDFLPALTPACLWWMEFGLLFPLGNLSPKRVLPPESFEPEPPPCLILCFPGYGPDRAGARRFLPDLLAEEGGFLLKLKPACEALRSRSCC